MTVFALQPAGQSKNDPSPPRGNRLITPAELKLVDGLTIRYRRHWPLSFIAENVARCRDAGKLYTLLLVGGEVKNPTTESHLSALVSLVKKLGLLYESDELCWGVHTAVPPTKHSEELFWGKPMPPKALLANKRLLDAWTASFPRQVKLLAGSANDPSAMRTLIEYGNAKAPGRFAYKINSMSAKLDLNWVGTLLLIEAAKRGAMMSFEALDNSSASRFGGTYAQARQKIAEIEKRAGAEMVYEAWYKGDISKLK